MYSIFSQRIVGNIDMKTLYIKIEGIHCQHCCEAIRAALLRLEPIKEVKFQSSIAIVRHEGALKPGALVKAVCDAGYVTKPEWISESRKALREHIRLAEFLMILAIILLASWLLKRLFGFNVFNMIPTIDSSITLGMLFATGLLTSVHCISMCGAINLSVSAADGRRNWLNPLLYNGGRVLSYTVIGGIVGAVGSACQLSDGLSGAVILLAGGAMLLMALSMLGVLSFHLPRLFSVRMRSGNALLVGLLNGLMPCGPLQAMQLYALSTGSWAMGALSMLLFGLGTAPAMLLVGLLAGYLNGKRRALINKISAVLILVLSIAMVSRGLTALGVNLAGSSDNREDYLAATMYDGYQQVEFDLDYDRYEDVVVQAGVPVRMVIRADENHLTGCNNAVESAALGFSADLRLGENVLAGSDRMILPRPLRPKERGSSAFR